MHNNYLKIKSYTLTFFTIFIITGCSKSGSNPTPKSSGPITTITSLSVNTGPYNITVVITGTGFSNVLTEDQVFFNGKLATVTAATSTQITTTVPLGANTGNVTVSVNNGTVVKGPVFTYQLSVIVSTLAGSNADGSANGLGAAASFQSLWGIGTDAAGNIYVADYNGLLIRKITPDGLVTTFAGSGKFGNNDGAGTNASFNDPAGLTVDGTGNVYVADFDRIRKIAPNGTVSTILINNVVGSEITGVAVDGSGNLYATDLKNNLILKINTAGNTSIFAGNRIAASIDGNGTSASFNQPVGVGVDASGNVFVVDESSNEIRKITPSGIVTTIAGNGSAGATNGKGVAASFNNPSGVTPDNNGNLYIADFGNNQIRKITADGTVSTLAGTGSAGSINGLGAVSTFNAPQGTAIDPLGNIYVANISNVRKITLQ